MTDTLIDRYLLIKRGLYWRPDDHGYTGLKSEAGRYSKDDAQARCNDAVRMVLERDAEKFAPACWEDIKIDHLTQTIATLTASLTEADDTLRVLDIALTETDAALFAREIVVIKQQRESIAAALEGKD